VTQRANRALAWLIILTGLTGCATDSLTSWPDPAAESTINRAEELAAEGRHQAAADAYLALAYAAGDRALRQRYLILMAHERLQAGFPEVAKTILNRLGDPIDASNLLLWTQVSAEISIATDEPEQALAILNRAPEAPDPQSNLEILRLKGNALFRTGQPTAATKMLIEREIWLDDSDGILANQFDLWESYQIWGGAISADADDNPILTGWLNLGRIAWTQRTSPSSMRSALRSWQSSYFNHPANSLLVPTILNRLPTTLEYPDRIAVLLPLSGQQKQSAMAVRDGLLAAHYLPSGSDTRPEIIFYDINAAGTSRTYTQAIDDGADFIVGPLLKEQVEELSVTGISAPTLTLNFLPEQSPRSVGFYQFSLSPEDEARQVARRATALGQYRALALAPNNDWGKRLLKSFTTELQAQGGQILNYQLYDPRNPDFSNIIERLLLIDESRARRDRLSANLGIKLEYEPRRRADIDLIFLAAHARTGKLIRPQLRFHYAGAVPTYSTSAIYKEGSRNNSDLNGIMFPDMPWVIAPDGLSLDVRKTLAEFWPDQAKRRSRLYALGFDAYRLIPIVYAGNNDQKIEGMTGTLYFDDRNRILRQLPWAKMQRGRPVLMNPIAEQERLTDDATRHDAWPDITTAAGLPKN
jgi:outer membrane PBP1 activator LpoA protein